MKKKLLIATALALMTAACSGPLCKTRGCEVNLKPAPAKVASSAEKTKPVEETVVLSDSTVQEADKTPAIIPVVAGKAKAKKPVLFKFDSADLTESGQKALEPYAKYMNKHTEKTVLITGYTDNIGAEAYNWQLSKNRAESAKAYLVGQGVAADRIKTIGKGGTNFIAENDTPEGRARNRRIELKFK